MKQINDIDLLNYAVEKFHCVPLVGVTDMNGVLTNGCTLKELIEGAITSTPDTVFKTAPYVLRKRLTLSVDGRVLVSEVLDQFCCACKKRIPITDFEYCCHCGTRFSGMSIQFVDKDFHTLVQTSDDKWEVKDVTTG